MTKEEINKKIYELKNEEEIVEFVIERIKELEDKSVETTVGQNYTTSFREYISEKTHYKPAANIGEDECPDLVYDDITPYVNLVKEIRKNAWYDEQVLFSAIFYTIRDYLPNDDAGFGRALTYFSHASKRISIKTIRDNVCAFCSENAGLAHNMFKFLGVDSEVVVGYRDSELHAYNMVYPYGYDNEPMVIYDPSFSVSFEKDGIVSSLGYFKALRREEYEKMMVGLPIKVDLTRTEKNYRKLYRLGEEYKFYGDTPNYIAGINNKLVNPGVNITEDLYYSAHMENGVESVTQKM